MNGQGQEFEPLSGHLYFCILEGVNRIMKRDWFFLYLNRVFYVRFAYMDREINGCVFDRCSLENPRAVGF